MSQVFISYSREDEKFREELEVHLKGLNVHSDMGIDWWSDARLEPGSRWSDELFTALNTCRIALLLVSKDFLASDFIATEELPRIFSRVKREELKIFWVLLSECNWELTQIRDYSAVYDPRKTLAGKKKHTKDKIWKDIIDKILQELKKPINSRLLGSSKKGDPFWHDDETILLNSGCIIRWFEDYTPQKPIVNQMCVATLQELAKCYLSEKPIVVKFEAPEPNHLRILSNEEQDTNKEKKIEHWRHFELLTARLYPRFRDAHLALLLHEKSASGNNSNGKVDVDLDRYHVKRILRGLLRKQREYNEKLFSLEVAEIDRAEFSDFQEYQSNLLLCHLAILWAIETKIFSENDDEIERQHWLSLSTQLCKWVCHWLLQAHVVARQVLELYAPEHQLSANSQRLGSNNDIGRQQ